MSKKFLTLAILALFVTAGIAYAQMSPTAKMEGKVVDSQGAPLPGVSVEATSPKMVGKATAVTDSDGTYRLFSLPSGTYQITFALQGFKTLIRKDIIVQLSQTIDPERHPDTGRDRRAGHGRRAEPADRRQEHGQGHDHDQGTCS